MRRAACTEARVWENHKCIFQQHPDEISLTLRGFVGHSHRCLRRMFQKKATKYYFNTAACRCRCSVYSIHETVMVKKRFSFRRQVCSVAAQNIIADLPMHVNCVRSDDGLMGDLTPKKVQVTREKLEYRGKRFSPGLTARPGARQSWPRRDARSALTAGQGSR